MSKIAKIINNCNECPHFVEASSNSHGKNDVALCGFTNDLDESSTNLNFLIAYQFNFDVKHIHWEIPENCPLEDYNETKNDC
jgi:hypothetical protein